MQNRYFGFWILIFCFGWLLIFGLLSFPAEAMGSPVPRHYHKVELDIGIDDFDDGDFTANSSWWVFDNVSPEVTSIEGSSLALHIKGKAQNNWYAGGMGVYLAKPNRNFSQYRSLEMDIYGFGPGQGTLKIELFDDDNGNWEIEQNTLEANVLLYDDRFVKQITVDWVGWKHIVIPLADFQDDNSGVGDDFWNVEQANQSGGLIQLQFICIASKKDGSFHYLIDNIVFTR